MSVGALGGATAARRVDASGLVIAPGFIDMLGQSEYRVLRDRRVASKVMQGITTELTGEASFTAVSHPGARRSHPFAAMFDREGVPAWEDLAGYLQVLDARPATINLGTFVSAGGVREAVIGREDRAATAAELAAMEAQVAAAMEAGAFGLSTSLQYVPDRFARTDELVALARVAGRYGGSYITHQRSEADAIDDSLDEVFRIAREGGVPAIVHHLKTAYRQNWGRMPQVLARIERARAEGLDIAADQYPYVAGSNPLDASLPVWAREGGRAAMVARLKDPATRAKIKAEILQPSTTWENQYLGSGGAAGILVSAVGRAELKKYQGRTLDDIATAERKDPLDALMDLIAEDDTTGSGVMFFMDENDVRAALKHPLVMLGTDSGGMAPDSGPPTAGVHPRAWGSAARILAKYVREERLLTLEEAVRKMTSLPARRMGLWDRGVVQPGATADLVVFDPATISDRATFAQPRQYADGMRFVAINGQLVVDGGQLTAARPGRALRGPAAWPPLTRESGRVPGTPPTPPSAGSSTTTSPSTARTRWRSGVSCSCRRSPPPRPPPTAASPCARSTSSTRRRPAASPRRRRCRKRSSRSRSRAPAAPPPRAPPSCSTRTAPRGGAGSPSPWSSRRRPGGSPACSSLIDRHFANRSNRSAA